MPSSDKITDYRLLGLIGQGQFAQVYCAVHRVTGQLVAIKQTRHAREQTSQEPFILHELDHPNVVGCWAIAPLVSDAGSTGGDAVKADAIGADTIEPTIASKSLENRISGYRLVLEYCEGGTLRSHLDTAFKSTSYAARQLPLAQTQAIVCDILQGLWHVHQQGIIHGDLKPENIFLTYHSPAKRSAAAIPFQVKIGDFGSARFLAMPNRSRREIGSPTYAAPERFEGRSSRASDLYSVGVILYELLLGHRPFSGSPEALRKAHQTQEANLPKTLSDTARQILAIALEKTPEQRFATAAAMIDAVKCLSMTATYPITAILPNALEDSPPKNSPPKNSPPKDSLPEETIPTTDLSSVLSAVSSSQITAPIKSLFRLPQGCCIITSHSLHMLTSSKKVLPIARSQKPCWISISPHGRWFVALPKVPQLGHSERVSKGIISHFSDDLAHQRSRSVVLSGPLLTALHSKVLTVIAIDSRYLLRVRVATSTQKTYLECFTRRGQFVGKLSLNFWLTQVVLSEEPYQLQALSAPTADSPAAVVVITLKPFRVKQLRLPIKPRSVYPLPWGTLVEGDEAWLLLDRSMQPLTLIKGVPSGCAIAAIDLHNLLFACPAPARPPDSQQNNPPTKQQTASEANHLFTADVSKLDLGLIF